MNKKRLAQIEQQIETIKAQLQDFTIMRPGSLTQQFKNPKEKTGGFYQLSYTHQMKSRTDYVRPQFLSELRAQITEYKKFRKLVDKWVALGIEYSKLSMKLKT